jgi:hypothetical protein
MSACEESLRASLALASWAYTVESIAQSSSHSRRCGCVWREFIRVSCRPPTHHPSGPTQHITRTATAAQCTSVEHVIDEKVAISVASSRGFMQSCR